MITTIFPRPERGDDARQRVEPREVTPHLARPRPGSIPLPAGPARGVLGPTSEGSYTLRELPSAPVQIRTCRDRGSDRDQVSPVQDRQPSEAVEPSSDRRRATRRIEPLWIYLPPMSRAYATSGASLCAPAMPASISACTLPSQATELFVTSNGRATPRPLSWRGWETRPWVKLLSGVTLPPLMAARGAAEFISSLQVIPVSRLAWQESAEAPTIPGTYGPMSPASSLRCGQSGSSVRTSRDTSIWDWPTSAMSFADWATKLRRACSQRVKSARAILGGDCSFWPTPTATDKGYNPDLIVGGGSVRTIAPVQVSHQSGGQYPLSLAARSWTVLWLLMKALGWRATMATSLQSSHPVRVSFLHGKGYLSGDLISNPRFYEMIMGWPIGWTAPGEQVTEFAAWLQRSRGALSRLLTGTQLADESQLGVTGNWE